MRMVVGLDIITFVRIGADEVRDAFGSGDSRRLPLRICHRCSAVGKVHFFRRAPRRRTSATAGRRPQSRVTRHRRRLAEPRSRPLSLKTLGFRGGWRSRQFSGCHGRWSRPRREMRKAEALSYDAMLDTPRPPRGAGGRGLNCDLPYKLNEEGGREGASEMTASAMKMSVLHSGPPLPSPLLPCPSFPVGGRGDRPRMRRRCRRRRHRKPYRCSVCVCTVQM